jgi:hypothetical protein
MTSDTLISITDIEQKGEYLGQGVFGRAYRMGIDVYKIPSNVIHDETYHTHPTRTARVWNEFFSCAYQGKIKHFARAESVVLKEGMGVLKTPYIESSMGYDLNQLNTELNSLDKKLWDINKDNVKVIHLNVITPHIV